MNKEEIIKRSLIILHTTGYTNELEKSLCIDAIEKLQQENKELKERIYKAIEYIKSFESIKAYYEYSDGEYSDYNYDDDFKEDLLEILKGE